MDRLNSSAVPNSTVKPTSSEVISKGITLTTAESHKVKITAKVNLTAPDNKSDPLNVVAGTAEYPLNSSISHSKMANKFNITTKTPINNTKDSEMEPLDWLGGLTNYSKVNFAWLSEDLLNHVTEPEETYIDPCAFLAHKISRYLSVYASRKVVHEFTNYYDFKHFTDQRYAYIEKYVCGLLY